MHETNKATFHFRIDRKLLQYVRAKARARKIFVSDYLTELIYYDKRGCIDKNKLKRKVSPYLRAN